MSTAEQEKAAAPENQSAMGRSPAAAARLQTRTVPAVAVMIGILVAAGLTGTAIHHDHHHPAALGSLSSDRAALGVPAGSAGSAVTSATTVAPSTSLAPTSSALPAKTGPGDLVLTDDVNRISVSVPAGWRALPVEANALAAALRGVTASNPQLAPLLSQPEGYAATGFLRILAVHTGAQPMVLGIIATPAPAGVTLDQLAQSSVSTAQTTSQGVNVQRVTLPAGNALQVSLKVPFNGQLLMLTQDLLIHNGKENVVQLGTVTTNPTDTVLNRVLGSFRFR
jgi:hypothetical protein